MVKDQTLWGKSKPLVRSQPLLLFLLTYPKYHLTMINMKTITAVLILTGITSGSVLAKPGGWINGFFYNSSGSTSSSSHCAPTYYNQPRPVYYQPQPVYYCPPPRPVYHCEPRPVYYQQPYTPMRPYQQQSSFYWQYNR